jgi:UDP-glucose 4-epimerase
VNLKFSQSKVIVTGCAGFIGSNLVDSLLELGFEVIGIDNMKTGQLEFLKNAFTKSNFEFVNIDILSDADLTKIFLNCDMVYHFAANADVRYGKDNPSVDLEQNTIVTHNVLEAMRKCGVRKIVFSSTGSIYGDSLMVPTPEDAPFPIQTSLYGASKLACEGLIAAYCETFNFQAWIFRFVSILGPRYSHGHIYDFTNQLKNNPKSLTVLGDGHQTKSYLHVSDCVGAINLAVAKSSDKINIFNLGTNDKCTVRESINWITETLELSPNVNYGTNIRGWVGDNPLIYLKTDKIRLLGWEPKYTIEEAVKETTRYLLKNNWLFLKDKQIEE